MDDRPDVHCPTCEAKVVVGLPIESRLLEVSPGTEAEEREEGRRKRRTVECPQGHLVAVEFEF